ncbi:hypothetical protein [Kitasatospora sp. NPDC004289]
MALFLGLGLAGIAVLALSLVLDGLLDGLFDGASAGALDGLLSLPVAAGFVAMFGFVGALVHGVTSLGTTAAVVAGLLAGTATGRLTWAFNRALMRDRSATTPTAEGLVGTTGTVVTEIRPDGFGEVLLRSGGQPVKVSARSTAAIERGKQVWVDGVLSPTAVTVRPTRP